MALISSMFQDETPDKRKELLQQTCDSIKAGESYTKHLSEDELIELRRQKLALDIKLAEAEEKHKEVVAEYKDLTKPMKIENGILLTAIRDRAIRKQDDLFMFRDEDSRMVGMYDEDGNLVSSRRMTPEEQQGSIYSSLRVESN